jgi:FixJ family two-component response regulator
VILSGPGWKEKMDMVPSLLRKAPHLPIVVVGERGGADTVLAAMRAGARDYLARPVRPASWPIQSAARSLGPNTERTSHGCTEPAAGVCIAQPERMRSVSTA